MISLESCLLCTGNYLHKKRLAASLTELAFVMLMPNAKIALLATTFVLYCTPFKLACLRKMQAELLKTKVPTLTC